VTINKSGTMRANFLTLLLILAVPLTTLGTPAHAEDFKVKVRTIEDRKAVFATVESLDRVLARTRISGTIKGLTIDEGSEVVTGQKIAVITDRKLSLKLAFLDTKMESLRAQRKLAATDLERAVSLQRSGAASQARLDETQTRLDIVNSQIESLKAEKSVVYQEVADGNVLAPASGRVLSVAVTNGSVVMPGETVAVIATNSYILRLRLPERHAKFMKIGDKVFVGARGVDATNDDLADGVVQQVYPEMENGQVIADVKVANLGDYFVGERTLVHVATGARQVIAAPGRFFHQRFGITFATLKTGGEVTLRLGLPLKGGSEGDIEVLSGLTDGDILVLP